VMGVPRTKAKDKMGLVSMSPLSTWPLDIKVVARLVHKYLTNEDEKNRGGSS